jgi:hypothetical protein
MPVSDGTGRSWTQIPTKSPHFSTAEFDNPDALERWLFTTLRPWSSPNCYGETFGPGHALEEAIAAIETPPLTSDTAHFAPFFFQGIAHQTADRLIAAMRAGQVNFGVVDEALGIDTDGMKRAGIPKKAWWGLGEALVPMKEATVAFAKEDMAGLERWHADDGFKREVFVFHAVALGRLSIEP